MKNKFNLFNISIFSIFAILLTRQLHFFNIIVRYTSGTNIVSGLLLLGLAIVLSFFAVVVLYYLPALFVIELTYQFNCLVTLPAVRYIKIRTKTRSIFTPTLTNQKLQVIRC